MSPQSENVLHAFFDVLQLAADVRDGDAEKIWPRLLEKLSVVFEAEAGTYYSFLPEKRHLLPRYAIGPHAEDLKETPVDIRTGLSGWVATHREPLLIVDAYLDPRFLREVDGVTGFKTKTVLALPLLDRHDLTGVIQLFNKQSGPFTRDDLRFVETCCRILMLSLRNAKLEATVEKVSARNASILENLTGGFMAVDLHGKIILCNPAAKRILELPNELKLSVPADQALMHAPRIADILLDTVATRKTVRRQEVVWSYKGKNRTIGYSTILIQDPRGETSGAGITFQDITPSSQ